MARLAPSLLLLAWLVACEHGSDAAPEPSAEAPAPGQASPDRPQPSPERARQRKSCENGEAQACFALAEMLDRGEGGPADPEQARALFEEACAGGSYEACDALGH